MTSNLGTFVKEIEIQGVTFYCRGLTAGEYIDLAERCQLRLTERLYIETAVCGVVGWSNFYQDGELIRFHPTEMNANFIDDVEVLVELGKFIYHNLSTLSEEEGEKFRGYIRFLYWSSDEKNEKKRQTFDCNHCLSRGISLNRNCGRFDIEFRRAQLGRDVEEETLVKNEEKVASVMSKYGNKKVAIKRDVKEKKKVEEVNKSLGVDRQVTSVMVLNKFAFPECPISWTDEWIKIAADVMYQAEKSDNTLFGGGLFDHPYKIYRASKAVKSEFNAIESERMEEERKKK